MARRKSTKTHSAPDGRAPTKQQASSSKQPDSLVSKPFSESSANRNSIVLCLLVFALIAGVFWPATQNDFLFWYGDDPGYVTENAHVKNGFTLEGVKWAFGNVELGNWHPLTFLSHMLDCQIFGLKPWGHHLTNVLFHAANAVLLFVVLRRMTGATWRCLAVALLFGLHPLRVESVAWVAERKDVLAAFFWMLTLLMYARYAEENKIQSSKSKVFYGLSLASFACGLMSKGIVVTLPFALLLLDYWPLQRHEQKSAWKLFLEKIPFFVLAAAASAITFVAQKNWGFVQTVEKYSLPARLENAVVSYGRYIGKMFWPLDLCAYYPHPGNWPMGIVLVAITFVIGISVLAIVKRRQWPWLSVGWFWYLGTLVPVIGIVQLGDLAMADRYSYIPMLGILLALVWGLCELTKHWRHQRKTLSVACAIFLIFCTVISHRQIGYFKDSMVLWRHAFATTGNIEVAQFALGLSLNKQGRADEAIKELQTVLRAKPERADIHFNLGTILDERGRTNDAIIHYSEAVRLAPGYRDARLSLALTLLGKRLTNEAAAQFQEMIKLAPDFDAYCQLGAIMDSNGYLEEAIEYFGKAVQQKPHDVETHVNLGIVLGKKGRFDDAIRNVQEALRLNPNSTKARACLDYLNKKRKVSS
jgi:protein O-mannosyl-transferase